MQCSSRDTYFLKYATAKACHLQLTVYLGRPATMDAAIRKDVFVLALRQQAQNGMRKWNMTPHKHDINLGMMNNQWILVYAIFRRVWCLKIHQSRSDEVENVRNTKSCHWMRHVSPFSGGAPSDEVLQRAKCLVEIPGCRQMYEVTICHDGTE